jgi:hypothetical protein
MVTTEVSAVLTERAKTHGDYGDNARVGQMLKRAMEAEKGWARLDDCQRESLHMIAHKVARILGGDPNVADHWTDIAGYSKLVADRIAEQDRVDQSWADAANKPPPARRLDLWSTPHLRAELQDLGRSPASPVGDALAGEIRAELERRGPAASGGREEFNRPGTPEDGGQHARQETGE